MKFSVQSSLINIELYKNGLVLYMSYITRNNCEDSFLNNCEDVWEKSQFRCILSEPGASDSFRCIFCIYSCFISAGETNKYAKLHCVLPPPPRKPSLQKGFSPSFLADAAFRGALVNQRVRRQRWAKHANQTLFGGDAWQWSRRSGRAGKEDEWWRRHEIKSDKETNPSGRKIRFP